MGVQGPQKKWSPHLSAWVFQYPGVLPLQPCGSLLEEVLPDISVEGPQCLPPPQWPPPPDRAGREARVRISGPVARAPMGARRRAVRREIGSAAWRERVCQYV